MAKPFKLISLLLFLCFYNTLPLHAQKADRVFDYVVDKLDMSFVMPPGFTELDLGVDLRCGDWYPTNSVDYSIVNEDKSILIAFTVNSMGKNKQKAGSFREPYDPVRNAVGYAAIRADSVNHTFIVYDEKYTREKFNSDVAGEYTRNCAIPYRGEYTKNRLVFFARADKGEMTIYYFFKDKASPKGIEDIVKRTSGMLRFN